MQHAGAAPSGSRRVAQLALTVVAVAGCGAGQQAGSHGRPSRSAVMEVHYDESGGLGGGPPDKVIVYTDGGLRMRLTQVTPSDAHGAGSWTVFDGVATLHYEPGDRVPYTRTGPGEASSTMPSALPPLVLRPHGPTFTRICPQAHRAGTTRLLGRSASVWSCTGIDAKDMQRAAHTMWLDDRTGLLLQDVGSDRQVVATSLTLDPHINPDTFSTTVPTGQGDANRQPMQDFALPRVGGGQVALTDRHGRSLIVVTGDGPGIRKVVARLLPLTGGGTSPHIIGLLAGGIPPGWKGSLLNPRDAAGLASQISAASGSFGVPVGIDVKGAAGYQISGAAGAVGGQTGHAGLGLVASDGTLVHAVANADVDEAQLRTWLRELS